VNRRPFAGLVVVVALLGAAACGSSAKAADPKGTPATNAPLDSAACSYLNAADATALFGIAAAQTPDTARDPAARASCVWKATDNDHHIFLLQIRLYNDAAQYTDTQPNSEHIIGLGTKAVIRKQAGMGSTEVRFVQAGKLGVVSYVVTNIAAKQRKNAFDQADQLVTMMKRNLSRL